MATVLRTRLDILILAMRTHLIAALSWPGEIVLVVPPDDISTHPQADHYLCLWPDLGSVDWPIFEGAGRVDARETVTVNITVRSRTALDESTNALSWLTDVNLGHLQIRHQIMDALDGRVITDTGDASGNWLVNVPLVPTRSTRPQREREDHDWGESDLAYKVSYIRDLNQAFQGA